MKFLLLDSEKQRMTEEEWLECNQPRHLLRYLNDQLSERKLRLFYVGCCRHIWELIRDGRSRRAVEVAEAWADGLAADEEATAAREAALEAARELLRAEARAPVGTLQLSLDAFPYVDEVTAWALVRSRVADVSTQLAEREAALMVAREEVSALLRDVVGNPFRPLVLASAWRTPTVAALAQVIYKERTFEDLPVLADALDDADCDNADILAHLRGPGPHVRGCWVLDLVLGKQ